jgi:hypothetical protein
VAVLLLTAGALAAVPGIRHSVEDWLGLGSVRIERVPKLPALPAGPGRNLNLGRPTTLAAAGGQVDFTVLAPAAPPDATYVAASPPGGQVAFVYRPRRGLPAAVPGTGTGMLITEFRGQAPQPYIAKSLGPGTALQRVTVGGGHGVWISGSPHQFAYVDAQGRAREEFLRLAGNTLLWRRGPLLLRLEANVSEATALRIANSLR